VAIPGKSASPLPEQWHIQTKVVKEEMGFRHRVVRGTWVEWIEHITRSMKNTSPKYREPPPLSEHARSRTVGVGQLTLVEHALCPLDPRASLVENLVHDAEFSFTDKDRRRCHGTARVICPAGLSAADEFYLWGLLAITLSQPEPCVEFHATPHFCLRRMNVVDQHARRGGRQYQQFTQAVERLSLIRYRNDSFYDPVRGEHRRVSFGFFSYSLPLNPQSSRAWRFGWDPVFFDLVRGTGGHFRFDLDIYHRLDPASRRLLLLTSKFFHRRSAARLDVRTLGVDVLGFAPTLAMRSIKAKVSHCANRLGDFGVLSDSSFEKTGRGHYSVLLRRGPYFDGQSSRAARRHPIVDSPVIDPLRAVGFDERAIHRLIREYPGQLLQEWADVTLAALERHGKPFFTRSPQAFFIDNVRNAAAGRRTPPDWWHRLRKSEEIAGSRTARRNEQGSPTTAADILRGHSIQRDASMTQAVRSFLDRQN
jgi:hypothetical protein